MRQQSVIVQLIYRSRGLKVVSRRFRNVKLHLQACLCVNVNKLYLNNTSRVFCQCWVCASQISSMKHNTKEYVYISCHVHIFLFGDLNVSFGEISFNRRVLNCPFIVTLNVSTLLFYCSEKFISSKLCLVVFFLKNSGTLRQSNLPSTLHQ